MPARNGEDVSERQPLTDTRMVAWTQVPPPDTGWWDIITADDLLAVEEPLEIRLAGFRVTVTMRTPGDDFDLVTGFLITEGILPGPEAIASMHHCPADDDDSSGNIINVNPADAAALDPLRWQRHFLATSSCGICGKRSIEEVRQRTAPIVSDLRVTPEHLVAMARELGSAQTLFHQTGGLHAAALFDREGQLLVAREDIGRHNAVDKAIGALMRAGRDTELPECILVVSSRASFEITQKALMAGIPAVAAVSAASSLAVELARAAGMTLAGFLRQEQGRFNVYAGEERITCRNDP
jgi:FdhD protein